MWVTVASEADLEIRHITLINHSDQTRRIRVISYGEVVLAAPEERHPAFNKLFIHSEYLPETNMLLFHRRARSAQDPTIYLGHLLLTSPDTRPSGAYEGDRRQFLGRGQTPHNPRTLADGLDLTQTVGITFDPIMALGQAVELAPYGRTQLAYLTLVAPSRAAAIELARRYRDWAILDQAFETARRQNEAALRQLEMGTSEVRHAQQLLALLLYPQNRLRAPAAVLQANTRGQSALWAYGISGDMPILVLRIGAVTELALVQEVLQAHTYWRKQQIGIEVVLLNLRDSGYSQELQMQLQRLLGRVGSSPWLNRRGGIFVVNADQMGSADRILLQTAARVVLEGAQGSVAEQLPPLIARRATLPDFTPVLPNTATVETTPPLLRPSDLQFDNGCGGFSAAGTEYVIYLATDQWTPAPWVNIIANEAFGFLVSETGAGYTWAGNSSENRLSPWRNDPVSDTPGEALYLRDEETARVWSPLPLPMRDRDPYLIRHGAGYTKFEHHSQGLKQHTQLFAVLDAPVKVVQLRLENTWNRPRRVTVTYYVEWVLGVNRSASQPYLLAEYDHQRGALLAR
jgi:cyclic beta-1,2-glucan synthetase